MISKITMTAIEAAFVRLSQFESKVILWTQKLRHTSDTTGVLDSIRNEMKFIIGFVPDARVEMYGNVNDVITSLEAVMRSVNKVLNKYVSPLLRMGFRYPGLNVAEVLHRGSISEDITEYSRSKDLSNYWNSILDDSSMGLLPNILDIHGTAHVPYESLDEKIDMAILTLRQKLSAESELNDSNDTWLDRGMVMNSKPSLPGMTVGNYDLAAVVTGNGTDITAGTTSLTIKDDVVDTDSHRLHLSIHDDGTVGIDPIIGVRLPVKFKTQGFIMFEIVEISRRFTNDEATNPIANNTSTDIINYAETYRLFTSSTNYAIASLNAPSRIAIDDYLYIALPHGVTQAAVEQESQISLTYRIHFSPLSRNSMMLRDGTVLTTKVKLGQYLGLVPLEVSDLLLRDARQSLDLIAAYDNHLSAMNPRTIDRLKIVVDEFLTSRYEPTVDLTGPNRVTFLTNEAYFDPQIWLSNYIFIVDTTGTSTLLSATQRQELYPYMLEQWQKRLIAMLSDKVFLSTYFKLY